MKKNYCFKTSNQVANEIVKSFNYLINKPNRNIIKIDITNTKNKHIQEFNFRLRKLFNSLRKKHINSIIDYLYVIEIPESISIFDNDLDNLKELKYHSHIVLNTDINEKDILIEIKISFPELNTYSIKEKNKSVDVYLENITLRNDLSNYANYIIKQKNTLTNYSFNYKIK